MTRAQLAAPGDAASVATTLFDAAETRPAGYPDALPFVPGHPVSVTGLREGMQHGPSAQWWGVPDPESVFARLLRASLEDGWARVPDDGAPALSAAVIRLRRGARSRTILASRVGPVGMVTLADRALG